LSLLLIDIGNTRVKWARLVGGKMSPQQAAANAGWSASDYARKVIGRGWASSAKPAGRSAAAPDATSAHRSAAAADVGSSPRTAAVEADATRARRSTGVAARVLRARQTAPAPSLADRAPRGADVEADIGAGADRIIVSSVAGDEVNRALTNAAHRVGAPTPEFVASERTAAGITTDYIDPWRLGVDRFVAAIGAHHLSSGQPVCVVNIGTAMTVDLVDGSGRHRGGAIVPGPALMVSSLLTQTNGIRRRAKGGPDGAAGMFAKSTRNAIGEGARYAAAGVIDRALEEARFLVGTRPLVILTGGGSADIKPLIRSTCVSLPDLVLHGLAVWAHQTPVPARPQSSRTRQRRTSRQPHLELPRTRQPASATLPAPERATGISRIRRAETPDGQRSQTSRKRRPVV
jgi:type III pantothenate kinase